MCRQAGRGNQNQPKVVTESQRQFAAEEAERGRDPDGLTERGQEIAAYRKWEYKRSNPKEQVGEE